MSYVTNVIMAFGIPSGGDVAENLVVGVANDLCPSGACLKRLDTALVAGGSKAMEVNLAIGAANYLDLAAWVAALRAFSWGHFDCHFVQLLVQGQDNDGFGSIRIWDDGDWSPGDSGYPDLFGAKP